MHLHLSSQWVTIQEHGMDEMIMGKVVLTWQPDNFSNLARWTGQKCRKRICPFPGIGVTDQFLRLFSFHPNTVG